MILGIDTGKKGSLVIIDEVGELEAKLVMPVLGREYDLYELREFLMFHRHKIRLAVVEKIHAMYQVGSKTTFEMGKGYGIIISMLAALQIPYIEVSPKKWQQTMCAGVKAKKAKTKSLCAFKRQFPELVKDFSISSKGNVSKNVHDGLIDALLLAEYGRRTFY